MCACLQRQAFGLDWNSVVTGWVSLWLLSTLHKLQSEAPDNNQQLRTNCTLSDNQHYCTESYPRTSKRQPPGTPHPLMGVGEGGKAAA